MFLVDVGRIVEIVVDGIALGRSFLQTHVLCVQALHLEAQLLDALLVILLFDLQHFHVESLLHLLLLQFFPQSLHFHLQRLHLFAVVMHHRWRRHFGGLKVLDWKFFGSIRYTFQ